MTETIYKAWVSRAFYYEFPLCMVYMHTHPHKKTSSQLLLPIIFSYIQESPIVACSRWFESHIALLYYDAVIITAYLGARKDCLKCLLTSIYQSLRSSLVPQSLAAGLRADISTSPKSKKRKGSLCCKILLRRPRDHSSFKTNQPASQTNRNKKNTPILSTDCCSFVLKFVTWSLWQRTIQKPFNSEHKRQVFGNFHRLNLDYQEMSLFYHIILSSP